MQCETIGKYLLVILVTFEQWNIYDFFLNHKIVGFVAPAKPESQWYVLSWIWPLMLAVSPADFWPASAIVTVQ